MARENTRGDIILLALTVTLVPPLALTAVEALLWAVSPRLRRAVHLLLVALLVAAFLLQLLGDGPGGSASVLIPIAVAVGVLAALAYDRSRAGPMLLTVLSPFPLVLLVVFLMLSPVSKLVLPGAEVETSEAAIPRDAPVVMIVFDELSGLALMGPDGEINESAPSFARLADDALVSRRHDRGGLHRTRYSRRRQGPGSRRRPIASDYPRSLFTLLGGKYSFDVQEPVTDICPERLCPGESSGRVDAGTRLGELASDLSVVSLHLLLPDDDPAVCRVSTAASETSDSSRGAGGPGADRSSAALVVLAAFVALGQRDSEFHEFSRGLAHAPERAHLSFLHVELPHQPYHFLPSGQRYPDALGECPVWGGLDAQSLARAPGFPALSAPGGLRRSAAR